MGSVVILRWSLAEVTVAGKQAELFHVVLPCLLIPQWALFHCFIWNKRIWLTGGKRASSALHFFQLKTARLPAGHLWNGCACLGWKSKPLRSPLLPATLSPRFLLVLAIQAKKKKIGHKIFVHVKSGNDLFPCHHMSLYRGNCLLSRVKVGPTSLYFRPCFHRSVQNNFYSVSPAIWEMVLGILRMPALSGQELWEQAKVVLSFHSFQQSLACCYGIGSLALCQASLFSVPFFRSLSGSFSCCFSTECINADADLGTGLLQIALIARHSVSLLQHKTLSHFICWESAGSKWMAVLSFVLNMCLPHYFPLKPTLPSPSCPPWQPFWSWRIWMQASSELHSWLLPISLLWAQTEMHMNFEVFHSSPGFEMRSWLLCPHALRPGCLRILQSWKSRSCLNLAVRPTSSFHKELLLLQKKLCSSWEADQIQTECTSEPKGR